MFIPRGVGRVIIKNLSFHDLRTEDNDLERRLLRNYGAMMMALLNITNPNELEADPLPEVI